MSASALAKKAELTPSTLLRHINKETDSMFEGRTIAKVAEVLRGKLDGSRDETVFRKYLSAWETGALQDLPDDSLTNGSLVAVDPESFAVFAQLTGRLAARAGLKDFTDRDKIMLTLKVYKILTRKYPKLTLIREEKELKKHEDAIELLVLSEA